MKKTISTTKKLIIALLICGSLFIPSVMIMMIDEDSPIAIVLILAMSFGFMILIPAFIIHLLKRIIIKVTSRQKKFESKNFKRVASNKTALPFNRKPESQSWLSVILCLAVLFPIGIYYLIRKILLEKHDYYQNGVKLIVIGVTLSLLTSPFLLLIICSASADIRGKILVAAIPGIYLLTGVFSIISGLILKNKGDLYEKYMSLITEYHITEIDKIKKELGTTYATVTKTVQKLIDNEMLPDSYIYHRDREIIVHGISKKIAIKCSSCGGTTVLYSNEEHICEYCGGEL